MTLKISLICAFLAACAGQDKHLLSGGEDHVIEKQSLELLIEAETEFSRGQYGNAERLYRQAVESDHKNVNAWVGLGATYDHLKKFDLANRAYTIAVELRGYTPEILNNMGYHYILRGDLAKAEKVLQAAQKKDPHNPKIRENLSYLEKQKLQLASTQGKN